MEYVDTRYLSGTIYINIVPEITGIDIFHQPSL